MVAQVFEQVGEAEHQLQQSVFLFLAEPLGLERELVRRVGGIGEEPVDGAWVERLRLLAEVEQISRCVEGAVQKVTGAERFASQRRRNRLRAAPGTTSLESHGCHIRLAATGFFVFSEHSACQGPGILPDTKEKT